MLPTLRLLIAAMLATVVVLICGFGIFAAFRVSRDPIAHLPAAAPPLQMVAEAGAASVALSAARDGADERPQFDIPINASEETAPTTLAAEQHAEAEFAAEQPVAAQSLSATNQAPSSVDGDAEAESVASAPPGQPAAASPPFEQMTSSAEGGGRQGDIVPAAVSDFSLPRPLEAAAEPSVTIVDPAIDATTDSPAALAEDAAGGQSTFAQIPAGKTFAALNPEAEPATADSHPALDGVATRKGPEIPPKPPSASAPRSIGHAPPGIARDDGPRRIERPVRTLTATVAKPKRARVAVIRPLRAARLTTSYYGQYAQSADQSYGYGQGDVRATTADQQQAAFRYAVRLRAARLAARKVNSAVGGPFVRAGGQ